MDHLAQDLSVALEESESCGPMNIENYRKCGMRRRTRSAGNLHLCINKSGDNPTDESSSSNSEGRNKVHSKISSFHQSDSDDVSFNFTVSKVINQRTSLRMKHPINNFLRGVSHSLESDSLNEHSPARPNLRRKRKLKRMSIDETPIPPCGKRKRSQRMEFVENSRGLKHYNKIKPLHQSIVDKIEKFCHPSNEEVNKMEIVDDSCEVASESSISWSGGEGHEGDDELTDWAPTMDNSNVSDPLPWNETDPREIRAGCRRIGSERPGFSISTGANERVAKFLQDQSKAEVRVFGAEREKLCQLAALYSLELWFEGPSAVLRKTSRTPSMQPAQRHHTGHSAIHKRIRTHHVLS
ncbi:G patch domain-containing protein 2 [Aethina tumida]|uniref:G patch domain-containing protein 2 n=1 Tax=Aethina tumida TaxID=116153 RepID=UPI002148FA29|nr:G patch domain-containing protein 2 [Aethina tumida]